MRQSLSCCIIVKNEEKKILSCLSNITILADEIVIIDTGSTDRTCEFIQQWVTKHNAGNNVKIIKAGKRFHDEDGDFHFGDAKTFAFENATKDYVMWIDASDVVTDQKTIKKEFLRHTNKNTQCYFVLPTSLDKSFAYNRTRIGRREYSYMQGRIHESMRFRVSEELERVFIPVIIKNRKKNRDNKRNLSALLKEWKENETGRTCFYIGNTYREMSDVKNALKWFRRRIYTFEFKEEFLEEYYKALECVAEISLILKSTAGISLTDVYDVSMDMIKKEPSRLEGYYYLALYYIETQQWEPALRALNYYKKCKKPDSYRLWLNKKIYSGKAILNLIQQCKTGIKYRGVLKPDQIMDLHETQNRPRSTFKSGNSQYM